MGQSGNGKMGQGEIDRIIQQQADANRINQYTPYGSLTYSPSGDTSYMKLSPQQQALLQQQQAAQLQAGGVAQSQLGALGAGRDAVEQAYFARTMNLLRPEYERSERALQQRLANQGLSQRGGAYDREYSRFERGQNEAYQQAALAATLAGGQEESRIAQMALQLLGGGGPQQLPLINAPQTTVPVFPPQAGLGGAQMALAGGLQGAGAGAAFGPWGAGIGAGLGGLLGLGMR